MTALTRTRMLALRRGAHGAVGVPEIEDAVRADLYLRAVGVALVQRHGRL